MDLCVDFDIGNTTGNVETLITDPALMEPMLPEESNREARENIAFGADIES